MQYDQLLGAWMVSPPCDASPERAPITLASFRQLRRIPGASAPACYQIDYVCEACGELHLALTTQTILDWEPLMGVLPTYFDFKLGRESWAGMLAQDAWLDRLLRGSWPMEGWCTRQRKATALHPSLLRQIAPSTEERYTVCFACPACQELEFEAMHPERLTYGAV